MNVALALQATFLWGFLMALIAFWKRALHMCKVGSVLGSAEAVEMCKGRNMCVNVQVYGDRVETCKRTNA